LKEKQNTLILSKGASRWRRLASFCLQGTLLVVTSLSLVAVLFIIYYIARDAWPFFQLNGLKEFFTSTHWYPSRHPEEFGALSIFVGSGLVTLTSILIAVPLGIAAAICLSDILPFHVRQMVKPVIEILAAIPSVAFGFFALVVFAPLLQSNGGTFLTIAFLIMAFPVSTIGLMIISKLLADRFKKDAKAVRIGAFLLLAAPVAWGMIRVCHILIRIPINSGTNTLNVSVILAVMALPTIVSVAEDALQSAGRELREGSYALGATRAETIFKVVIPAAGSGIIAAVILGVMRSIGETMVVWMASGNAAQIPDPWFNILQPVRTLTATIAGDMGEADQVTGSARYHVLFAMALCLLLFSFLSNLISEWIVNRSRKKLGLK